MVFRLSIDDHFKMYRPIIGKFWKTIYDDVFIEYRNDSPNPAKTVCSGSNYCLQTATFSNCIRGYIRCSVRSEQDSSVFAHFFSSSDSVSIESYFQTVDSCSCSYSVSYSLIVVVILLVFECCAKCLIVSSPLLISFLFNINRGCWLNLALWGREDLQNSYPFPWQKPIRRKKEAKASPSKARYCQPVSMGTIGKRFSLLPFAYCHDVVDSERDC